MAGLLDDLPQFLASPAGQGLIGTAAAYAANARRGAPVNNIGRGLLGGMAAYGQANELQMKQAEEAQMRQLRSAQMENYTSETQARKIKAQQEQLAMEKAQRIQQGIPGLFTPPGMTGGEAIPQTEGGVPMFSRPMQAAPMRPTPGGFDVRGAINLGLDPKAIQEYAGLANIGRPEVARTVKAIGPDGREYEYQIDKYGQRVGDGMPQYRAPLQVNQGDRTTFADAYSLKPVGNFQTFQSPDSKATTSLGYARLGEEKRHNSVSERHQAEQVAQGAIRYEKDAAGNLVALPTKPGPGPIEARPVSGMPNKNEVAAKNALGIIAEAERLIDGSTGSYLGAGYDMAAQAFGHATNGSVANAKLKALEGALMMSQPRMEGPQSDKDVALYRQMAAQIGDPTVPAEAKKAALETVKTLHQRYAPAQAAATPPPANPAGNAPFRWDPAKENRYQAWKAQQGQK